jgi:hypothetical protein
MRLPATGQRLDRNQKTLPATGQPQGSLKTRLPATGQHRGSWESTLMQKEKRLPVTGRRLFKERTRLPATGQREDANKKALPATGQREDANEKTLPATGQRDGPYSGSLRRREKRRMTVSLHKVPVALKRPTPVPDLIAFARRIVEAMTGNSWFPAPVPPLASIQAAVDTLAAAEADGRSMTRGLKEKRNAARSELVGLLNRLKAYVQGIADENPETAASIIESAAMSVAAQSSKAKPALAVYPGQVSGTVRLVAKAAAKAASYEWQMSLDGGDTWTDLPKTLQARTTVSGLVPGKTVWLRMRATTRSGGGDPCDPVSYVVQ